MKNQPKIDQKSTKNRSKIHEKSILEVSWGLFGGLERLGGLLGGSWGPLGGLLGRLGGFLGASWWPTWFQVDPQKGAFAVTNAVEKVLVPVDHGPARRTASPQLLGMTGAIDWEQGSTHTG